jgi:hypothetical protein
MERRGARRWRKRQALLGRGWGVGGGAWIWWGMGKGGWLEGDRGGGEGLQRRRQARRLLSRFKWLSHLV